MRKQHSGYLNKREQKEMFLAGALTSNSDKITKGGLNLARNLGIDKEFVDIMKSKYGSYTKEKKQEIVAQLSLNFPVENLEKTINSSNSLDEDINQYMNENNQENIPIFPKINKGVDVKIPDQISKYVDILLDIHKEKMQEYISESGMSNILSEGDVKDCFDRAVKEYNSIYPDTLKNNANIANRAEKLI